MIVLANGEGKRKRQRMKKAPGLYTVAITDAAACMAVDEFRLGRTGVSARYEGISGESRTWGAGGASLTTDYVVNNGSNPSTSIRAE